MSSIMCERGGFCDPLCEMESVAGTHGASVRLYCARTCPNYTWEAEYGAPYLCALSGTGDREWPEPKTIGGMTLMHLAAWCGSRTCEECRFSDQKHGCRFGCPPRVWLDWVDMYDQPDISEDDEEEPGKAQVGG